MKEDISAVALLYPDRSEVWETSDGLLHLTQSDAEAQAKHLPSAKIKPRRIGHTRKRAR